MAALSKLIGLSVESNIENHDFLARAFSLKDSHIQDDPKQHSWVHQKWRDLDNKYIKKYFGGDLRKNRNLTDLSILFEENESDEHVESIVLSNDSSNDNQEDKIIDNKDAPITIEMKVLKSNSDKAN